MAIGFNRQLLVISIRTSHRVKKKGRLRKPGVRNPRSGYNIVSVNP
jgi:hypothetical protein